MAVQEVTRNFFAGRFRNGVAEISEPEIGYLPGPILGIGWGARIRTWEWRNQNPCESSMISKDFLDFSSF
jgi:hypothetical protein